MIDVTTLDPLTLAVFAVVFVGVGVFAGLLAGLLGVGGGIVIVPALYHLFSAMNVDDAVKMHVAVGTSLTTIIATSISSLRAHHKRGAVDVPLLKSWGPAVIVGALCGAWLATIVSGAVLLGVFGVIALAVSLHMALGKEHWRLSDDLPKTPVREGIGFAIGGFSVMMGIGGGTLSVPTLVLFNFPIRRAVGTASAIGLLIAIPGALGFLLGGWDAAGKPPFTVGYVNLVGAALILPLTVLCAPLGARIAHAIPTRALRVAFAVFLFATGVRMLIDAGV